jgi:Gamma tubulin complex component C-terminal
VQVAARLWRLLVVASGLPAHLAALKDYMLLSRGDFWQCFLADARKLLSQPPRQRGADNDIGVTPCLPARLPGMCACLCAHVCSAHARACVLPPRHTSLTLYMCVLCAVCCGHLCCLWPAAAAAAAAAVSTATDKPSSPPLPPPALRSLQSITHLPSLQSITPLPSAAAWASAAAKSTAQDDPLFGMYKLVLQQQQQQQQQQQPPRGDAVGTGGAAAHGAGVRPLAAPSFDAAWDGLSLEVTLPWPLGVLFTPRQLARYNALFQLLLRLKRVQLALEEAWHELGRCVFVCVCVCVRVRALQSSATTASMTDCLPCPPRHGE